MKKIAIGMAVACAVSGFALAGAGAAQAAPAGPKAATQHITQDAKYSGKFEISNASHDIVLTDDLSQGVINVDEDNQTVKYTYQSAEYGSVTINGTYVEYPYGTKIVGDIAVGEHVFRVDSAWTEFSDIGTVVNADISNGTGEKFRLDVLTDVPSQRVAR